MNAHHPHPATIRSTAARGLALAVAACLGSPALARPPVPPATEAVGDFRIVHLGDPLPLRPHLALVLSGGGARGAAHVGVLKVLEELRVAPDLIVGTSMGAVVGGLYAAGYGPGEIENLLETTDWGDVFVDRIPREDRSFRRKQDDETILIPARLRFRGWKPYLPPGVLGGQRLELLLRSLTLQATDARNFNELPIPYRAVAADIETGEAIVLGRGVLAEAMRASMSIAGAFPPAVIEGRRLVDGGAVANVPVGVAQALGAERVIVVDISSPLDENLERSSFVGILNQLSSLLTVGNSAEDIERMRDGDVLIQPDLGDISFSDFKRAVEAVEIGERAARGAESALRSFSRTPAAWEGFAGRHRRRELATIPVESVTLDNDSWVDDRLVLEQLKIEPGPPLDDRSLRHQLIALSGLEYFGIIRDDFRVDEGRGALTVVTPAKPYSRGSLQFGISLESDLQGGSTYAVTARHILLAANRRGGEWVNVLQVGSDVVASSTFYQPLDWGQRWFVSPAAAYSRRTQRIWQDGEPVAEYSFDLTEAGLDIGRVLGNWGEVRAGLFRGEGSAMRRIGDPIITSESEQTGGYQASFRVDTLDTVVFPTRGTHAQLLGRVERDGFGAFADSTLVRAFAGHAFTIGSDSAQIYVEGSSVVEGDVTVGTAAGLGGFLRLSGLGHNELLADTTVFARALYYRELLWAKLGALSNRVFAGISLETGNAYAADVPITWPSLRYGAALFVGADTLIGPAYLGWGWTEPDRQQFYFVFGQRF